MLKRKKLVISLAIAFLTTLALGNFFQSNYTVPIIMYHSVASQANPENRLVVSAESFERQMRFLKKMNYNVVALEAIASLIKEKKKIPARTIAITFDDGYIDNYTYAFPVLKKYNLPATIFIIIDEVGRSQQDRLNWAQIKEMHDSGLIHFGSHCFGPEPLANIKSEEELKRQISGSRQVLEERLGAEVKSFRYPGGLFNADIRGLVIDAGYQLAVATNPGRKFPNNDIFALKRLRISSSSNNLFVFWVETSGYYNFMREHRHK